MLIVTIYPTHSVHQHQHGLRVAEMLDRIKAKRLGLKLYQDRPEIVGNPAGTLYESRTALYVYSQKVPKIRVINQSEPRSTSNLRLSSLPPHANPIGEMLHWSVLDRWKRSPLPEADGGEYRPVNVEAALKTIYASDLRFPTHVVGRNNEPLKWVDSDADYVELRDLLPSEHQEGLEAARSKKREARVSVKQDERTFAPVPTQRDVHGNL